MDAQFKDATGVVSIHWAELNNRPITSATHSPAASLVRLVSLRSASVPQDVSSAAEGREAQDSHGVAQSFAAVCPTPSWL